MQEKIYQTEKGNIHYWTNKIETGRLTLVLLPGLTADHRLFEKQITYFAAKYNILVWDAPGHHLSRPFELSFSIEDMAKYLHGIIEREHINLFFLIGQSLGGYIAQSYMNQYNGTKGFISIDSAPLQRSYLTAAEIWLLKRTEIIYRPYPWKALLRDGANGCATTEYGRNLMKEMMESYQKKAYCDLTCHGYRILAEAMEKSAMSTINCPALLLCGEYDKAGASRRYNKKWTEQTHIPLIWIKDAGHNSNTDNPEMVNHEIEKFIKSL